MNADPTAPPAYDAIFPMGNYYEEGGEAPIGSVTPLATGFVHPTGFAMDAFGDLYVSDSAANQVLDLATDGNEYLIAGTGAPGFGGDGGPATSATLDGPTGLAFDAAGDLFISDSGNNRVREVDTSGTISTVAGTGVAGFDGDGGPAALASLDQPTGLASAPNGVLFIADSANNRVREVAPDGTIASFAGTGATGFGGDGGPAVRAILDHPTGLAVDGLGDLYIADTSNNRVREVTTSGVVITVAGNGRAGSAGDDEQSNVAQLDRPTGVVIDGDGDLFIADTGNGSIRAVNPTGIISTVGVIEGSASGGVGGTSGTPTATDTGLSLIAGDPYGNIFAPDPSSGQAVQVASDPDDQSIGPAKAELADMADEVGLTSTLVPLARTTLELAAILVVVTNEGGEAGLVETASIPNQPPASIKPGTDLRIDRTSEETEALNPFAPATPSPLLEYLMGLNVSFVGGRQIITAPSNDAGAAATPSHAPPDAPPPGPVPVGPEVAPGAPAREVPAPGAKPEPTPDQAARGSPDEARDRGIAESPGGQRADPPPPRDEPGARTAPGPGASAVPTAPVASIASPAAFALAAGLGAGASPRARLIPIRSGRRTLGSRPAPRRG